MKTIIKLIMLTFVLGASFMSCTATSIDDQEGVNNIEATVGDENKKKAPPSRG